MSTSVASVLQHFPDAENGFTTSLSATIASGATTVGLNSVAGYTNGEPVVLVVDPSDVTKKQTFTGIIDTAGVQITSVVWTAGTNQTHTGGATVVDYATATHIAMMSKGIKVNHTQKGNHKTLTDDNANEWIGLTTTGSAVNYLDVANAATATNPVLSAKGDDSNVGLTLTPKGTGAVKATLNYDAWVSGLTAPSTVTALGNRSYSVVINSTDYTDRLSAGMRLKLTRTVTAPTQCTSLNGTTQYYSKSSPAGYTFTDSFTYSAWVKPSSYALGTIIGRYSTTGSMLQMNASGQLLISAKDAGTVDSALTYQSLPLNKWSHVAMTMIISSNTVTAYIDGVAVPTAYTNGTTTAVTQAGSLEIGGNNGGTNPFPGKIAQAAVYSAVLSSATILAAQAQTLAGTETSLVSAYSFNNTINDLNTTSANNLTANGSAVATNADSPYGLQADGTTAGTTEYGIITKTAFSTNTTLTVQVPEGNAIPTSGGVSAVSYSTASRPYGMPTDTKRWAIEVLIHSAVTASGSTVNTVYNPGGVNLAVPIGAWDLVGDLKWQINYTAGTVFDFFAGLSSSSTVFVQGENLSVREYINGVAASSIRIAPMRVSSRLTLSAAAPYYALITFVANTASTLQLAGSISAANNYSSSIITATLAYL